MNDPLLTNEDFALKLLLDSPVYVLKEDQSTILAESEIATVPSFESEKINYKGSFAKKLLFIISGNDVKLSENDWDLFNKTITALKLSIDDIAIIENEIETPINDFNTLLNELKPNKTVVFGKVNTSDSINNNNILYCETLKSLSENKEMKIQWWNSLKSFLS